MNSRNFTNELSNDGTVLYSATRSTGQIEEGPGGYSGPLPQRSHSTIDQENTSGVWKEQDLLGTQLGPSKNGRKW